MDTGQKYMIVDDDPLSNMLCNMVIESVNNDMDAKTFTEPIEGLEFIKNEYIGSSAHTVLFLDINMPMVNGWEFLERYDKFSDEIKTQFSIYMLSSSVDPQDKRKADANKYVKGFISKPLDHEMITVIDGEEF